jgi:hypothetical protein
LEGARCREAPVWLKRLLSGRSERVKERKERNGERAGESGRERARQRCGLARREGSRKAKEKWSPMKEEPEG